jgi:hypothetical protein
LQHELHRMVLRKGGLRTITNPALRNLLQPGSKIPRGS